jgi:hypothetical protein
MGGYEFMKVGQAFEAVKPQVLEDRTLAGTPQCPSYLITIKKIQYIYTKCIYQCTVCLYIIHMFTILVHILSAASDKIYQLIAHGRG